MNDINKFQTHFASCIAVRSLLKKSVPIDKFRLRIILCNTKIRTPTCLWYVPLKIGEVPKRVILAYLKTTLNYSRGTYGLMGTFTYYVEHYLHFEMVVTGTCRQGKIFPQRWVTSLYLFQKS